MKLIIRIEDDNGTVLVQHEGDPMQPTQKKSFDKPLCEDETYRLFGIVYQPLVQLKPKTDNPRMGFPAGTFGAILNK